MSAATKLARLDSLVAIVGGGTPSKANPSYFDGVIPWVTPKDMRNGFILDTEDHISQEALENSSSRLVPQNSVLVVVRSGILKHTLPIALNTVPVAINQDMKALICNSDVHPSYLAYAVKYKSKKLLQRVRGTTADNIPLDELKALTIPVPALSEQKRIAAILDRADAIRRKRQQALQLSDEFLRALFLDMFGDPVRNPKGWPILKLADVFSRERAGTRCGPFGSTLKKADYEDTGIPVWGIDNVLPNRFVARPSLFISQGKFEELRAFEVKPGDILISRAGTVGRMCVARDVKPSIIGTNLIRLSLDAAVLQPEYFCVLFTYFAERFKSMRANAKKEAYSFMNTGVLASLSIPVPPRNDQQRFLFRMEKLGVIERSWECFSTSAEGLHLALSSAAFRSQI